MKLFMNFKIELLKCIEQLNSSNPIIIQINEWQKTMNKKIDQIAEQARQHAIEVLDSK